MTTLEGTPSDDAPDVLATGRSDIDTVFISMSTRHPEGRDADYIEWHSLDHRPEQYRLAGIRASLRIVSTPACRAARAASEPRYEAVDHVMTYMFAGSDALKPFNDLGAALRRVGRIPGLLPMVERGVYAPSGKVAAPRIKAGADVLPWWPATGVYLLVEEGSADPSEAVGVEGVGGAWWMAGLPVDDLDGTGDRSGLQITYLFLDEDPPVVGERLRPLLERRWSDAGVVGLLAAPFHLTVPYEWDRFVP